MRSTLRDTESELRRRSLATVGYTSFVMRKSSKPRFSSNSSSAVISVARTEGVISARVVPRIAKKQGFSGDHKFSPLFVLCCLPGARPPGETFSVSGRIKLFWATSVYYYTAKHAKVNMFSSKFLKILSDSSICFGAYIILHFSTQTILQPGQPTALQDIKRPRRRLFSCGVFSLPSSQRTIFFTYRIKMAATCARVASPCGSRIRPWPLSVPFTRPAALAHASASRA